MSNLYRQTDRQINFHYSIYTIKYIQNQVLRIFAYKQNVDFDYYTHDYKELYIKFKIKTLESAREISDLKFLYKLINNIIVCEEIRSLIGFYVPNREGLREKCLTFNILIEFRIARKTSSVFRILETYNSYNKKIDITNNIDITNK